jgi:mitochondrial intermembrane space import and assembly protein 40
VQLPSPEPADTSPEQIASTAMASPESTPQQHHLTQESSTSSAAPAAAGQEEAPQEPVAEPAAPGAEASKEGEGEGEEEEGECEFCLYMKAGGCKDAFTAWMDCVEASDKVGGEMVERCAQTTINLKNCMDAHADYYAPLLQAEQAVSDQAEATVAAAAEAAKDKGGELSTVAAAAEAAKDKGGELPAASTPSSAEDNKEETDVQKVDPSSSSN